MSRFGAGHFFAAGLLVLAGAIAQDAPVAVVQPPVAVKPAQPTRGGIFDDVADDKAKTAKETEEPKPRPKLPGAGPSALAIHDWGVWVADATLDSVNGRENFPSALPPLAVSPRSRAKSEGRPMVAPFSALTFHGLNVPETDVEIRGEGVKFVAHWPKAEQKGVRLRWLGVKFAAKPSDEGLLAFVGPEDWLERARKLDALYCEVGTRLERALLYDVDFPATVPIKLEGGPDRYKLVNLWGDQLLDVFLAAPAKGGVRLGRAAELKPDPAKVGAPKGNAPAGAKTPGSAAAPAMAGQITVVANPGVAAQPAVMVQAVKVALPVAAPPVAAAAPVAAVADAPPPATVMDAKNAKDPKATKDGKKAPAAPPKPAGGPPVEIAMAPPVVGDGWIDAALKDLAAKLVAQGLQPDEAALCAESCRDSLARATDLVAIVRLPASALDRYAGLDIAPDPRRIVRTRLLVIRNLDPAAKGEIEGLIGKLGDADYEVRSAAELKLGDLGSVAWPNLRAALKNTDLEIVWRIERILLKQKQPLEAPKGAPGPVGEKEKMILSK
jgi:hypothetical protein